VNFKFPHFVLLSAFVFAAGVLAGCTSLADSPMRLAESSPQPQFPKTQGVGNARATYPADSRAKGEQGRVVVKVLIDVDGRGSRAEVQKSSGYPSLDKAALDAVTTWKYVPAKRNGVPEAMWFDVPIVFSLH
jgi:protein TonB